MAIEVMSWVWNHSRSRNGARLVLLAVADSASSDGTNAWPSIATLQRKANMKSDRSVQNAIKELIELGELKVELNKGQNGSNRYTVLMGTPAKSAPPQKMPPAKSAGAKTGSESGTLRQDPPQNPPPAKSAPPQNPARTPANSAEEPSIEPSISSSSKKRTKSSASTRKAKTAAEPHPRFAEFWAAYPLRVSVGDARAAFADAVEAGADPDVLIAAAGRYARHCQRTNKERHWIRHGSTWLHKESWLDDLGPDEDLPPQRNGHQPYQNPTDQSGYDGEIR